MPKAKYRVRNGEVDEVSLVGKGANDEEFLLLKSADVEEETEKEESTQENSDSQSEGGSDGVDKDELVEAFKELDEGDQGDVIDALGITKEEEAEEENEEQDRDLEKEDLPEEVRKELEEKQELKKQIQQLQDERDLERFTKQVENDYDFLPGETGENAEILKSASDHLPEDDYERLVEKLDALAEQVDLSGLTKEAGQTTDETVGKDVVKRVEKRAKELVEDGDDFDNMQAAKAHVITEEKPEWYREYKKQKQNQ